MTTPAPTPPEFLAHLAVATSSISGHPLDASLEAMLNRDLPAGGPWFDETRRYCLQGQEEGWLCGREAGGIKFGRAAAADPVTHGMSVDVVEMSDVIGPHHAHPNGEIDLVMPLTPDAQFDGRGAGWKVYEAGSAHRPTVTGGKAVVLYLLPGGEIRFTRD
ncbi:DUF4863 family protein [Sphingopyxis granuli]|uniref:4-hydroxylaminobenzoate lyase n=1 Tax=Sphingopyxis granuli TaxID=267128 RepID=UPI00301D1E54